METSQVEPEVAPPIRLEVKAARWAHVADAVRAGTRDLAARPGLSLFFGLIYAAFGAGLFAAIVVFDTVWAAIPVALGFPLVAPFLAAGLYEISRRLGRGEAFSAGDIFGVVFRQRRREFAWMAFVVMFVFWIWAYQVRILLAIILQNQGFATLPELVTVLTTTAEGAIFLTVGSVIGAALATFLYSVTVISLPLLLDKDVDFVTAIITSVKAVLQSPAVMLGWGAAIGAATLVSVMTGLLGVIVIFPVLGHAAWHLYRSLVTEA